MTLPAFLTLSYWSAKRGAILIGFVLTILGSAGSQFFLDPPQRQSVELDQRAKDITADIDTLKNAQAQYLMFQQQGALIYALNVSSLAGQQGNQKIVAGNLYQLSLIDRSDAMRTLIGQLAIAGIADFGVMHKDYMDLVEKARKDVSLAAYTKMEDFEKSVMTKAADQMAKLQQALVSATKAKAQADALADERKLILLALVTVGSTFLLLANLISTKEDDQKKPGPGDATTLELTSAHQIIAAALRTVRDADRPPSMAGDLPRPTSKG